MRRERTAFKSEFHRKSKKPLSFTPPSHPQPLFLSSNLQLVFQLQRLLSPLTGRYIDKTYSINFSQVERALGPAKRGSLFPHSIAASYKDQEDSNNQPSRWSSKCPVFAAFSVHQLKLSSDESLGLVGRGVLNIYVLCGMNHGLITCCNQCSFTVEEVCVNINPFKKVAHDILDPCAHGQASQYPKYVGHCPWYVPGTTRLISLLLSTDSPVKSTTGNLL